MKILVIEDEPKTGDYLRQGLVEAGFVVDLARDGHDGLHQALTEAYDLAILDIMLPGIDGWQVLQGIRKAGKEIPVLFLTAKDSIKDRVKGLETGADDSMTIWSSPLPLRSCWPESGLFCAVAAQTKSPKCSGQPIWSLT